MLNNNIYAMLNHSMWTTCNFEGLVMLGTWLVSSSLNPCPGTCMLCTHLITYCMVCDFFLCRLIWCCLDAAAQSDAISLLTLSPAQAACLAKCNGANVMLHRSGTFSLDEFRQAVIDTCTSGEEHLVVSVPGSCCGLQRNLSSCWICYRQLVFCAERSVKGRKHMFRVAVRATDLICAALCCAVRR